MAEAENVIMNDAIPIVEKEDTNNEKDLAPPEKHGSVTKGSGDAIPKMDLAKFFDLIGQIDIVLRHETSLRIDSLPYPFESVQAGEIRLDISDEFDMQFDLFVTGDNNNPWIMTRFDRLDDFSNFDEYICAIWNLMWKKFTRAQKIVKCPPTTVWRDRNPDPTKLGYPVKLLLKTNHDSIALINNIIDYIQLRDENQAFVKFTACGDVDVLRASEAIIDLSIREMPALRNLTQNYLNLVSTNVQSIRTLRTNTLSNYFNVLFDYRPVMSIYRGLPFAVRLAYESTVKAISPQIPIHPVMDTVIVKESMQSATRSGWLSDIAATQYMPHMAADFSAIVGSLLAPGYISIYIDWSDVPEEATEFAGFIAVMCKALFMRSDTQLDNITDEAAREIEDRIVELGIRNKFFARRDHINPEDYPLENVDAVIRFISPNALARLRTDLTGRGWMNSNRRVRAEDGFGGIYDDEMEMRPVYAVNCSNWDEFLINENIIKAQWDIFLTIEDFSKAWARNNSALGQIVTLMLSNLLKFFVRLNEFLRVNFYTGLRLPADMSRLLIGEYRRDNALRYTIKAKSVLAFVRSVGHQQTYTRKFSIIQQLKVETQNVRAATFLRTFIELLLFEIRSFRLVDEYGRNKIWSMALKAVSEQTSCPLIAHLTSLQHRMLLSSLNRMYLARFYNTEIANRVFVPLSESLRVNTSRMGFLRSFYYSRNSFRTCNIETLRGAALNGTIILPAVETLREPPYEIVGVRPQLNGWLTEIAAKYRIDTLSLDTFANVILPLSIDIRPGFCEDDALPLTFKYGDVNVRVSDSITFRKHVFGFAGFKSDDIRNPDNVAKFCAVLQTTAMTLNDFNGLIISLDNFIAALPNYTFRVTALRDTGIAFIDILDPLL